VRRVSGFVFTLLGTFLLVVAVLLRLWVAPGATKFPLNAYQITTLTGTGSYFSATKVQELQNVSVGVTETTRGDVAAGSSSLAVWDTFTSVQDLTNRAPISYFAFREAFDRKTGVIVPCCREYLTNEANGKPDYSVHMSGQSVVWPFGAQKKTYMIFDTAAARAEPAQFAGTSTINGIAVYRYVETVAPTRFGSSQIPGSIAGLPSQSEVTLGEYYSATNTYWVDPVTGVPLKTTQDQEVALVDSTGVTRLVGSDLKLTESPASVQAVIQTDKKYRNEITLAYDVLPLIGLILGLALLIIGIVLVNYGGEASETEFRWLWRRQLSAYPDTGRRVLYLAITVLATVTLYYELYVGGSVSTLLLVNLHMSFTFFVLVLAFGNLIGAFGSLFAGLSDRLGRANLVVFGLLVTGIITTYVLPAATNKWAFSIEFFVVSVVEGIALVATPALIRDFSPQVGRATAMGFWTAGPVLGSLIVTAVATNTLPTVVTDPRFWTHEYKICGTVGLIVFVIALIGLRELSPQLRDQLMVSLRDRLLVEARAKGLDVATMLAKPFRQLFKVDVVVSAIAVSMLLLIYYTAVGFGLIYLSALFGYSTKNANGLLNWNWGFNVIAVILIGMVSDLVRVRKPFMVIGGVGTAVMIVIWLNEAGKHPGYYTLALILAVLSLFLGIAYTPWMASFTETVEARNPALIATGLAIWGWTIRVVIFVAFLIIPHVITSVTPLVDYGPTAQSYQAAYPKQIAFAQSHPQIVAQAQKYQAQLQTAQKFAPELAVLQAHAALFTQLGTYSNPAAAPPKLINEAIAAAGGGAKGLGVLTTIQANQKAIESVIAVQGQLLPLQPYAAQLTALSKVPPSALSYLQAHGAAVQKAEAQSPNQWKHWYWVCFGGVIFFLLCIPLLRGRWNPAAARRDEEEHEAATEAEMAKLRSGPDTSGSEVSASEAWAPDASASEASAPEASAPEASAPQAEVPDDEVPEAEAPRAEVPEA
jgi:MFS family permease